MVIASHKHSGDTVRASAALMSADAAVMFD